MFSNHVIFVLLLSIDQLTRKFAPETIINHGAIFGLGGSVYRWPLVIGGILIIFLLFRLDKVYIRLYGPRPWFTSFYMFVMIGAVSATADRIIFAGGRDFIQAGPLVVNLGDLYCVVGMVALTIELATNRRGNLKEIIKCFSANW